MEKIWEIDLKQKYIPTNAPISPDIIGLGFMWWSKFLKEKTMLKCKYNEDCSRYPMCGKTCGLSLEELVWLKNAQIRELERKLGEATFTLNTITSICHNGKNKIKKADYEPTCPYGYMDCISDPAYIRAYHPKWWEELGMPTECSKAKEYEEDCSCQWYDDEDK